MIIIIIIKLSSCGHRGRLTGQYLMFNESLVVSANMLILSNTGYFCQQWPNSKAILSPLKHTQLCTQAQHKHTHTPLPWYFYLSIFKKKKKKKRIYWTVTAFSNNPPWERAVRKSRHTIESESFSGKMQYNHGAFLSALHCQKRRRYASFLKRS